MFPKFIDIFENILSFHAPLKLVPLQLPTSREQWKFIKNRINSNSQIEKNDKLREGSHFVEDDRKIAKILNNCFARLGLYKGKDVSTKHSSLTFEGPHLASD